MPEDQARRFVLHVEQVELLAEATVVALFRLFKHVQVGVKVFLLRPGGAVDALQLFVAMIAAPIGTSHLHQLEHLELAGRRHVRATTEIDEIAFAVQRHLLICGNRGNQLGLVLLALTEEEIHRIVAIPDFTRHRNILLRQFGHALFDGHQIFRRERALVGKIVVEAVFDNWTDGHLCFREQFLDRVSQQVRRRMTDQLQGVGVAIGDDGQINIFLDAERSIDQLAINLASQRSTRQAGTDAGRHLGDGDRLLEGTDGTIRKLDIWHGRILWTKKKCGLSRTFFE